MTAPTPPPTGNANLTTLVSIGNSLTAGYQNGALYESAQMYSFGNLIAQQVQSSYAQPLVSDPGIPGRLELKALSPSPVIEANSTMGQPLNSTYAKPYNNLGIPGAILYDITDTTDFAAKSLARKNPYFSLVLRNSNFGKSILQQAIALNPTFVTLWIGNNDVLGYATSGGTKGTDATGKLPTDANVFGFLYNQVTQALAAAGAKVVVANIPDVKDVPFFTTVGPSVAAVLGPNMRQNPAILGMFYQKNGEIVASGLVDSLGLANLNILLTLTSSPYAALLGQPTDKFYTDNGITPPPGIDVSKPFGFHPQNPWPDALVLDADEQATAAAAIASFNATILATANSSNDFALVDINSFFKQFKQGKQIDGLTFSTSFILGRLFGLDGVHPTSQGQAIVANEFIKVINSSFGAQIPLVNVSSVPGSTPVAKINLGEFNMPVFKGVNDLTFIF